MFRFHADVPTVFCLDFVKQAGVLPVLNHRDIKIDGPAYPIAKEPTEIVELLRKYGAKE